MVYILIPIDFLYFVSAACSLYRMQINTAVASSVLFVGEAVSEWLCTGRSISCSFYYIFGVCMRRNIFSIRLW